jgi:hypothetical protein
MDNRPGYVMPARWYILAMVVGLAICPWYKLGCWLKKLYKKGDRDD